MIYGTVPWDPHDVWRECPAKVQSSRRFRHSVQDSLNIDQHRSTGQRGVQASAQHFGSASSSYNDVTSQKSIPLHWSVLSNIIFFTNMMLWWYKASRPTSLHQTGLRRSHLTTVSSLQTNLVSQKYFKNRLCSMLGNKAAEQPRQSTPLDHSRECLFFHSIHPWLWICMMLRRLSDSPSGRSTRIGVIDWHEQDVDRGLKDVPYHPYTVREARFIDFLDDNWFAEFCTPWSQWRTTCLSKGSNWVVNGGKYCWIDELSCMLNSTHCWIPRAQATTKTIQHSLLIGEHVKTSTSSSKLWGTELCTKQASSSIALSANKNWHIQVFNPTCPAGGKWYVSILTPQIQKLMRTGMRVETQVNSLVVAKQIHVPVLQDVQLEILDQPVSISHSMEQKLCLTNNVQHQALNGILVRAQNQLF